MTRGDLIVISGFSGAGKGTLMQALMEKHSEFCLSVSMTTRQPRESEVDGREYYFVSREEFEDRIKRGMFLEYATYVGNYYGTPLDYVERMLDEGRSVILEIEVQGALQIREKVPDAVLMFVTTPDIDTLYSRLKGRGTENEETIMRRLRQAAVEAELIGQYDYIVVNDEVDRCADRMYAMICAAKAAPERNTELIETLKKDLTAVLGE
ncbi:MAG: guanylate kinase [Lachnospiraceae bacterium]|nr:guanylate kinase [Lachnospiraceae bacterium]